MKKKNTMKMRREWVNEVLDTLNDLEEKAETNGESALMWEILKTVRENIEIGEQGGNALFFVSARCRSRQRVFQYTTPRRYLSRVFCKIFYKNIFPKMLDTRIQMW